MVVVVVATDAALVPAKAVAGNGAGRAESTVEGAFGRIPVGDTKCGGLSSAALQQPGGEPFDAAQGVL